MTEPLLIPVGDMATLPANRGLQLTLTPELVRAVADKVYAMLVRDLQIEQERLHTHTRISQQMNLHR